MIISPERIPVAGPWITDREVELVADAARNAWYQNHYHFNARFERAFADYIGVQHSVSLPHATAALHLALAALGIGPGDEVIAPDVTWIASVAPITYVGAEPVFVDIDPVTWCVDPEAVEAAIGPRTRAIIGVDLYGSMCDWTRLEQIAERHGLALIEDAAEALGSSWRGRRAGAFGRAAAFSFHGSKTLATGEGGMLVTNDAQLMDRVFVLRDHGRVPGDRFFQNYEIGFKYRMNGVTAALGLGQIERIDELIAYKRAIFGWYKERLQAIEGVAFNAEPDGVYNSFWMVSVVPDESFGLDKFRLMAAFLERNIDTRPFFSQLSSVPAFAAHARAKRFVGPNDKGVAAAMRGVNLPSGYNVTESVADLVCAALKEILFDASVRTAAQ
jgi:perosamine synthetase